MFKVITGRYRSLEQALVEDVGRLKQTDPLAPALLVCPSGHVITRLQKLLLEKSEGILNVHTMDFYALAQHLLADGPPSGEQWITEPALYSEVIQNLIEGKEGPEFVLRPFFKPDSGLLPKGLATALSGTLRDLRDSGARVVDCLQAALDGHLGEAAPEAAPTLELYARVYEVLQSHGLRTPADLLRRASAAVATHPFIQRQKAIYLYGFYDLTGVQLDFVLAFAQHENIQLYFVHDSAQPAYDFAKRLLEDPALTSKTRQRIDLKDVTARSPTVEIGNCSGRRDEVWLAAKKILALTESGVAFHDIALSARTLEPYIADLREVFAEHHIPYATPQEEKVGGYPFVKWVRQLFSLTDRDFTADTVFDVLKSPYFRWDDGARPLSSIPQMEAIARNAGVGSGWTAWNDRLNHWSDSQRDAKFSETLFPGASTESAVSAARSLRDAVRRLNERLKSPETALRWSEHARWAENVLRKTFQKPFGSTTDEDRLWDTVLTSLQGLSTLDALEYPVSLEHFRNVWDDKLSRLTMMLAPSNNTGVQALDIMSARGLSFKALLLLGMNEKVFPRLIREDPFLSDAARGALASSLGCRLNRQLDGYQEERLLFQLATEMPEEHLYLSYQRSDDEGKALIPSLYLHGFDDPAVQRRHLARSSTEKWRQTSPEHLTPKEMSVWLNRQHHDTENFYRVSGFDHALYKELAQGQDQLENFGDRTGRRDGTIGVHPVLQRLIATGFSPNSLKELAECPFRYFAGKVLDLERMDDFASEGELASDVTGKLIHRILEIFFEHLQKNQGRSLTNPELQLLLEKSCAETFRSYRATAADLYPLAWTAAQKTIRFRLTYFLKEDLEELAQSGFKPTYFEEEIDGKIPFLTSPLNEILFRGRVDRIDLREQKGEVEFRVVDYKTGRPTRSGIKTETGVLRGQYLQLPVYLGVAGDWLKRKLGKDVKANGAAFYNLADRERGESSPSLTNDFWKHHGKMLSESLSGLLQLVQAGVFYIRPSGEMDYCSWCHFSRVCRREHKPSALRSEQNPLRIANDERLARKAERD